MRLPRDPRARELLRMELPGLFRETQANHADGDSRMRNAYLAVLGYPVLIRGPDDQWQRTVHVLRRAGVLRSPSRRHTSNSN